jgi:hypothetical protein
MNNVSKLAREVQGRQAVSNSVEDAKSLLEKLEKAKPARLVGADPALKRWITAHREFAVLIGPSLARAVIEQQGEIKRLARELENEKRRTKDYFDNWNEAQREIEKLREKHAHQLAAKERIYEVAGIKLEDDPISVINFVEWWRELWASWQKQGEKEATR